MSRRSDRSELKSGSIIAALALALALLGGCSAVRFAYNQAPDVAYWWLDAYVDFTDAQTPRARDAIAQWFGWHRRTQLPDYAALLARAQTEVLADQSSEQACTWLNTLRDRTRTAADHALPFAAGLALALSPAQIKHIERRYDKNNREFRDEYLQDDPKDRLKASVKRTVDRAEMLYGRLDDAQVRRLTPLVADSPFDPALWFAERQRRQQDLLQLLRRLPAEQARPDAAEAALRAYVQRIETSPNETYRRYMQRLEPYNCNVAAALHNITTPAQRQAAAARLKGWESDLRSLSGTSAEQ